MNTSHPIVQTSGWLPIAFMTLALIGGCGGGGKNDDPDDDDVQVPVPAPTVRVDPAVRPLVTMLPGEDGGPERSVEALTDASGIPLHFVTDELIVVSDDLEAVRAIASRWGGSIERSFVPADFGLAGSAMHLLRIDSAQVDATTLPADLAALDPDVTGELRLSGEAGLRVLAAAARESVAGTTTALNVVMLPSGFRERTTTESASLPVCGGAVPGPSRCVPTAIAGAGFTSDAYTWSYMGSGSGTQNIGVGEAWRALDFTGGLNERVRIAVIDGGFTPADDTPGEWEHFNDSLTVTGFPGNDLPCSGNTPCPWHGTNVVAAAMGGADDRRGAAGPAGPVARATTIRLSGDAFNYLGAWAIAFSQNARVLNMSFGARIPALVSFVVEPLNIATGIAHEAGMLLVAAAGNDNADVDSEDCFLLACWEDAWFAPCENNGVLCVGALADNSAQRRASSNYGKQEVDIFGPGAVWVGSDGADNEPHAFTGTSAASPFVAGVGALVFAANPALSGKEVAQILVDTAHASPDGQVRRYVNAFGAVVKALGGTPACLRPEIPFPASHRDLAPCRDSEFRAEVRMDESHFGPFEYRWRRYVNDLPVELVDGGRISGSDTDRMTIAAVRPEDAGLYDLLVTNICGSTASAVARLRVVDGEIAAASALAARRAQHAMAYDSARGRMVVHGGWQERPLGGVPLEGLDLSGDTMERDASGAWRAVASAGPPARYNHAMAYDQRRGVTVLFGGYRCPSPVCIPGAGANPLLYADTWEWDGSTWTERTPVAPPPARFNHAMVYDPVRQRVLMHGGRGVLGSQLGELWEWDGSSWELRGTTGDPTPGPTGVAIGLPLPREDHVLAFDTSRSTLVMHGGVFFSNDPSRNPPGDTWELDQSYQWTRLAVPTPVTANSLVRPIGMAYDSFRNRLMLVTGQTSAPNLPALVWRRTQGAWQPVASMPERSNPTMAHDSGRGRITIAGGSVVNAAQIETWEWVTFDLDAACPVP